MLLIFSNSRLGKGEDAALLMNSFRTPPPPNRLLPGRQALNVLLKGSVRHRCIQKPSGFGSGVKSYVPPPWGEKGNTLPYPELPGKPLCYFGWGGCLVIK